MFEKTGGHGGGGYGGGHGGGGGVTVIKIYTLGGSGGGHGGGGGGHGGGYGGGKLVKIYFLESIVQSLFLEETQ